MDNLNIDIKKKNGILLIKLEASVLLKGEQRIRIKSQRAKGFLIENGFNPGICLSRGETLDNSKSCSQFNLLSSWEFEDLDHKTKSKEAVIPQETATPKEAVIPHKPSKRPSSSKKNKRKSV